MIRFYFVLLFTSFTFLGYSQDKPLFSLDLKGLETVQLIPNAGRCFTVQIGYSNHSKIYDRTISIGMAHFKCGYVKQKDKTKYLCLGLYSELSDAREAASKLSTIYTGAFPVAYQNGEKVHVGAFDKGDLPDNPINFKKAKKEIKKLLKKSYYRIQVGYFEKAGYEPAVQENLNKIEAAGFDLEEETYKNGRRVLTVKKFKTVEDLYEAVEIIEGLTDIYAIPKEYSPFEFKILRDYDRFYKLL
jgi:hypothetical protein